MSDPWVGISFAEKPDSWAGIDFSDIPEGFERVGDRRLAAPSGESGAEALGKAPGDIAKGIKETIVDPYIEGASGHPGALNLAGPIYGLGNILRRSPESPAAQLASDVGMSGGLPDVPTKGPPSAVEQFLNEADVASARAAGAKTRGEIKDVVRNKKTASAAVPEGFETVPPESRPPAQPAETSTISTPGNEPGIVPGNAPESRPPIGNRSTPARANALALRDIDIDPVAALAAKAHEAAGLSGDDAYERAIIEAALADKKVRGFQDGEQLPTAPEPAPSKGVPNAPAQAPRPSQGGAGAGAGQISAVDKGITGRAPKAATEGVDETIKKALADPNNYEGSRVFLTKIREALPNMSHDEQTKAIKAFSLSADRPRGIQLYHYDNKRELLDRPDVNEINGAAVHFGGYPRHFFFNPEPPPAQAPRPSQGGAGAGAGQISAVDKGITGRAPKAYHNPNQPGIKDMEVPQPGATPEEESKLSNDRIVSGIEDLQPGHGNYVLISNLKNHTQGITDEAIFKAARAGKITMAPYGGPVQSEAGRVIIMDSVGNRFHAVAIPRKEH